MVLAVSLVSLGRRAVVSLVSEGVDGRHAEASAVSTSLRRRGLCAKKFALRRCFSAKARKTSPCVLKTPQIRCFCPRWASFFADEPLVRVCWASFFADEPLQAPCWASFFAATDIAPGLVGDAAPSPPEVVGGLHYTKPLRTGFPSCADGGTDPRCTRASRTAITKPPGARPGGGGAGDGNRTRL